MGSQSAVSNHNLAASRTISVEDYATSQAMIDINLSHLHGLRTQCELTNEMTQQEVRVSESKLVKLFGRQWLAHQKAVKDGLIKHKNKSIEIKLWLKIVGLPDPIIEKILKEINNDFDTLIFMETNDLKLMLKKLELNDELQRRVLETTQHFNTYIECFQADVRVANDLDLHWDSWDENVITLDQHSCSSLNSSSQPKVSDEKPFRSCPTSPPNHISKIETTNNTLPNNCPSRSTSPMLTTCKEYTQHRRFSPKKKTPFAANSSIDTNGSVPIKSKSHEEKLSNKANAETISSDARRRLATESEVGRRSPVMFLPPYTPEMGSDSCFEDPLSGHSTHQSPTLPLPPPPSSAPPIHTHPTSNFLPPPRSPRAHGGMMHDIHHRFVSSMKLTSIPCELCKKPMIFGFKCKECKYRCHKECIPKVPPSCGLPSELMAIFKETIAAKKAADHSGPITRLSPVPFAKEVFSVDMTTNPQHTPHMLRKARIHREPIKNQKPFGNQPDSSSNSSCNSSNASSPALKQQASPRLDLHSQTFTFPDTSNAHHVNDFMMTQSNLMASNGSNIDLVGTGHSGDLADRVWPRQNSLSLREWDIPIDEVKIDRQIGRGRFGTVFKANWHGLVALKIFTVSNFGDADSAIAAFKMEVATLRKTRHDNLVLFMGACMKPPKLAIVTSFCKGDTLHCHVHLRKERFPLSSLVNIGQQITQGMGYLHARGILHKDLKTSNIFYDSNNSRVTITDFGLFSLTKLCIVDKNNYQLQIPKGWLAYLAPELIRMLRPDSDYENDNLPFSIFTDIYSFGTVWHELLSGIVPYKSQPPEVVIWQVGKGMKQPLRNLQSSKEIKDILMLCWSYRPQERPDFSKLSELLKNLPKRRLQRSPSHPTHLLRSLESLF